MCDTSQIATIVAVSPVRCLGLLKMDNVNSVWTLLLYTELNLRLDMRDRYKVRIGKWNVGTLTGRSIEKEGS